MRRRILTALAGTLAALALVGCSAISSGYVVDKVYEPGRHYTAFMPAGKVMVPYTAYDDPDWRLDIRKGDEEGFVYVSEEVFDSVRVGDFYEEPKQ